MGEFSEAQTPNYSLWVRMMKKNHRGKGCLEHTSDEAPWKSARSLLMLMRDNQKLSLCPTNPTSSWKEKKGQKSQHCKEGLTKDRGGYSIHI
ncbi:hypothetical protein HID58_094252 [Brassica napus]|uniref:Uncharacterized protein n=1 Tax=Brassica napus TaxID=3708 RepID=A0ABQ7X7Z4_BRANA|nr:hypothetical protein HID58_094252 [Brassica napus]